MHAALLAWPSTRCFRLALRPRDGFKRPEQAASARVARYERIYANLRESHSELLIFGGIFRASPQSASVSRESDRRFSPARLCIIHRRRYRVCAL